MRCLDAARRGCQNACKVAKMPEQAAIWFVSLIVCLYDTVDQLQIEGFRSTRDRKKYSTQ